MASGLGVLLLRILQGRVHKQNAARQARPKPPRARPRYHCAPHTRQGVTVDDSVASPVQPQSSFSLLAGHEIMPADMEVDMEATHDQGVPHHAVRMSGLKAPVRHCPFMICLARG